MSFLCFFLWLFHPICFFCPFMVCFYFALFLFLLLFIIFKMPDCIQVRLRGWGCGSGKDLGGVEGEKTII